MRDYIDGYKARILECGTGVLNVKIPREVLAVSLDKIGTLLNAEAERLLSENENLKTFLADNPLPDSMAALLPDSFRVFSLLLNALKQWVSAESAATDRYLMGGTARETCRNAVDTCLVTGEKLQGGVELHHPMRDGRPPIPLSKKGHDRIEQSSASPSIEENSLLSIIKQIKKLKHLSWVLIREGLNAKINNSTDYRPAAMSGVNFILKTVNISPQELSDFLDENNLNLIQDDEPLYDVGHSNPQSLIHTDKEKVYRETGEQTDHGGKETPDLLWAKKTLEAVLRTELFWHENKQKYLRTFRREPADIFSIPPIPNGIRRRGVIGSILR
jgi:hypothetical protein